MRGAICSRLGLCCMRWRRAHCPFVAKVRRVIFKAILDSDPVSAVRLNPDVPPELEDIINKALEKDRDLRYQHASEMRTDLQAAEAGYRITGRPAAASSGTVAVAQESGSQVAAQPAVASIRFLPCACSISVIERREGRRSSCRGQETLEGSGSRR